jgi:DNA-binding MarR family transcriptional regulator
MPGVPKATVGSVAELLGMDRTTLTAAARVLFNRGLMTVEAEPDDRRSKILKLTAEGRKVLADAVPIWKSEHAAVEAELARVSSADSLRESLRALRCGG